MRRIFAAAVALLAAGIAVVVWQARPEHRRAVTQPRPAPVRVRRRATAPLRLAERSTGTLAAPVEAEAGAALGAGRVMLVGGLTAADTSRPDIRIATPSFDRPVAGLPLGLHDTAAVRIGSFVYVLGGGTAANGQSDAILRVPVLGGTVTKVGRLPAKSADQSAVAVGGTAYVIGGYTGSAWLDTVVAWTPGRRARVVARLPFALRYAAVTVADGVVVIAGGSLENGTTSRAVLAFSPVTNRVSRLATLPVATTHAAAAAVGGTAYVIGGRSSVDGAATARIVGIDVAGRRVVYGGALSSPRSDLAAVAVGRRILLAGGRGALDRLSVLEPARRARRLANVYANDAPRDLATAARDARQLVYVPNSGSDTVDVIDPRTFRIVRHFAVGGLPQHIVPAWDLRTLYVTNDTGNSLTAVDPRTGAPGRTIAVVDPYNLYFTPDGRYAIVVAEREQRLDFRNPRTFELRRTVVVPCRGVDHMDFTADGRFALASCEFSGQMIVIDVSAKKVVRTIRLRAGAMPQDVKLSPDGRVFYVADLTSRGLWEIGAASFRVVGLLRTGAGAHGLYPSRDARELYVSNRSAGTVSVVSFRTRRVVRTWRIPGGSPDMGGVSADGRVLWLTGRYNGELYALSTRTGRLLARIRVGAGPHGASVWPQPGRYSLGHTGILR